MKFERKNNIIALQIHNGVHILKDQDIWEKYSNERSRLQFGKHYSSILRIRNLRSEQDNIIRPNFGGQTNETI